MKSVSLPVLKQLPKLRAPKAHRNHRSDELGKLRDVDVPPAGFVCNFTERGRRRLDLTPRFDRVDRYLGATNRVQAKFIYLGVVDPRNFHVARRSSLHHQLLVLRPRCNTYLRSCRIVRLPGNHAALPKKKWIRVRVYFSGNLSGWLRLI